MTVFIAFVIAVSASGTPQGASHIVANESACKQVVARTVLQAQSNGAEVVSLGCHPVEVRLGEGA